MASSALIVPPEVPMSNFLFAAPSSRLLPEGLPPGLEDILMGAGITYEELVVPQSSAPSKVPRESSTDSRHFRIFFGDSAGI